MFDGNRILKPSELNTYKIELYIKAVASAVLVFLLLYRFVEYIIYFLVNTDSYC